MGSSTGYHANYLDIEESLARAITAEEELQKIQKITVPAFPNDVNKTQFLNDINYGKVIPGIHNRRYGSGKVSFQVFFTVSTDGSEKPYSGLYETSLQNLFTGRTLTTRLSETDSC